MKIHLIAFNCRYSHSCLALFYVRQALERHLPAAEVQLHQLTINDPYFETVLTISGLEAEALFFSAYIWNASYLDRLLPDLHRIRPELPIVLGGPHAASLQAQLPFRATVVHNEIEGVERGFYRDLAQGRLQDEYRSTPGNAFPSPYKQDDFQSQLKNRNIYYESSRGCPFACAYCLSSLSRGVVTKELETVCAELGSILGQRPTLIRFVDRTFNADPKRALAIWRFLRDQAPSGSSFHFEIAPDLFTEEMFEFLGGVAEGLFQFEIGIQSTNRETLTAVNRKMDVDKALASVARLMALGTIHLHVDLILGLPMDDEPSFAQSVREVLALQPHHLQMGLLKVLPETAIAHSADENGLVACRQPPYQVMATRWMDHQTLSRLYWLGECVESFYNKRYFKSFFSYLIPAEGDIFAWFAGLAACCARAGFFSLSKTQSLMNDILHGYIHDHAEAALLRELLILDWLTCGHRSLPDCFHADPAAAKEWLWHHAPETVDGLYSAKDRNYFFKHGMFFKFTARLLSHCGHAATGEAGYLGFFSDHRQPTATTVAIPYPADDTPGAPR